MLPAVAAGVLPRAAVAAPVRYPLGLQLFTLTGRDGVMSWARYAKAIATEQTGSVAGRELPPGTYRVVLHDGAKAITSEPLTLTEAAVVELTYDPVDGNSPSLPLTEALRPQPPAVPPPRRRRNQTRR